MIYGGGVACGNILWRGSVIRVEAELECQMSSTSRSSVCNSFSSSFLLEKRTVAVVSFHSPSLSCTRFHSPFERFSSKNNDLSESQPRVQIPGRNLLR